MEQDRIQRESTCIAVPPGTPKIAWKLGGALIGVALFSALCSPVAAEPTIARTSKLAWLDEPIHLRSGATREWLEFPQSADFDRWKQTFDLTGPRPNMLRLYQKDVKQRWKILLNGEQLGELVRDENAMWVSFPIPKEHLRKAGNTLEISPYSSDKSDDIWLGKVELAPKSQDAFLSEAKLKIRVREQKREGAKPVPCRITITDHQGVMVELGLQSDTTKAVRQGTVYTLTGTAEIPIPAGKYRIYAGRGVEYSLAQQTVQVKVGETRELEMSISRVLNTRGYVGCDTHVHTRTHSGHGDCTVQERMVTLAAEGIELPVATDHNVNIDHRAFAKSQGADPYFTPVIGNEVTTRWGHFNVFPFRAGDPPPDHRGETWKEIFDAIESSDRVKVVILNHARDLHGGFRPFGPKAFNNVVAANTKGWRLRANAMEVINSSATQTAPMQLFEDWMAVLNSGHWIAPIGCSDSHDVARHFVGQARTYVRISDHDVANIDVDEAASRIASGSCLVSYGLLVDLKVAGRWRSGETAAVSAHDEVPVTIQVQAPPWIVADAVTLYANGRKIRSAKLAPPNSPRTTNSHRGEIGDAGGHVWTLDWRLPRPRHDVFVTAIATGPGILEPYWRTAKPYQPDSPAWTPRVIGCSGAVRLDVDGDGRYRSAAEQAQTLVFQAFKAVAGQGGGLDAMTSHCLANAESLDSAACSHVIHLLQESGVAVVSERFRKQILSGKTALRDGYVNYLVAIRRHLNAQ